MKLGYCGCSAQNVCLGENDYILVTSNIRGYRHQSMTSPCTC